MGCPKAMKSFSIYAKHMLCFFIILAISLSYPPQLLGVTTGSVSGIVKDRANQRPLAGANVVLLEAQLSTVTDAEGKFQFIAVPIGDYTLEVSLVGYQTYKLERVRVSPDVNTSLEIALQEEVQEEQPLVVQAPAIRQRRAAGETSYLLGRKEEEIIRGQPNLLFQYPGAILGQPGAIPDALGRPHIRGGRSEHTAYYLDGILVTEPNTNGFFTNLVTVGLDRFNLITGGLRPEYGLALSGVANVVIKTGQRFSGTRFNLEGGNSVFRSLLFENGGVRGKWDWYFSSLFFRTNFRRDPSFAEMPVSSDSVAKITYRPSNKDRLIFLLAKGYERFDLREGPFFLLPGMKAGPDNFARHNIEWDRQRHQPVSLPSPEGDYTTQGYFISSVTFQRPLSEKAFLSTQLYRIDARGTAHMLSPVNRFFGYRRTTAVGFKTDFQQQFTSHLRGKVGFWLFPSDNFQYLVDSAAGRRPVVVDPVTGETGRPGARVREENVDSRDMASWLDLELTPTKSLTLNLGLRWEARHYDRTMGLQDLYIHPATAEDPFRLPQPNDPPLLRQALERQRTDRNLLGDKTTAQLSPRLGLAYEISPKTTLRFSWGRYILFPPASVLEQRLLPAKEDLGPGPKVIPDYWLKTQRQLFDLKPERSTAVDLGLDYRLNSRLTISVTPYWARQSSLIQRDRTPSGLTEFVNTGKASLRGLELKAELLDYKGLSGWLSYTLSRSEATHGSTFAFLPDPANPNKKFRVDWDQRHTLTLALNWNRKEWEISPVLHWGSGFPYGTLMGTGYNPSGYKLWQGSGDPRYAFDPSRIFNAVPILGPDGRLQAPRINSYQTGGYLTVNLLVKRKLSDQYVTYLAIQNLFDSRRTLVKGLTDPFTRQMTGYHPPTPEFPQGYYTYQPVTVQPPIFITLGISRQF